MLSTFLIRWKSHYVIIKLERLKMMQIVVCLKDALCVCVFVCSGSRMWFEWRRCSCFVLWHACVTSNWGICRCSRSCCTNFIFFVQSELDETLFANGTNLASFVFVCHCRLFGSLVNRWHSLWHTHWSIHSNETLLAAATMLHTSFATETKKSKGAANVSLRWKLCAKFFNFIKGILMWHNPIMRKNIRAHAHVCSLLSIECS